MKPTDLAFRLTAFLREYLPSQRNASPNTVKSYGQAFSLLLIYCRDHRRWSPDRMDLDRLTPEIILAFLEDLEVSRHCTVATRNQRLAAVHSFFRYLQEIEPGRLLQCQRILSISCKRASVHTDINHLTPEQIKKLLATPGLNTPQGRRDTALLALLYDAAIRVQELIDLTPSHVRFESPSQIRVIGKGRKRRLIPLMPATAELLRVYQKDHHLDVPERRDHPLFFNRHGSLLTRAGVSHIVRKYAQIAESGCQDSFARVTPHTLRHSKAMHLLQSGNPLVVIQSILGHADIRTTTVYAKADLEMTRATLEKTGSMTPESPPQWKKSPGLLDWLCSL